MCTHTHTTHSRLTQRCAHTHTQSSILIKKHQVFLAIVNWEVKNIRILDTSRASRGQMKCPSHPFSSWITIPIRGSSGTSAMSHSLGQNLTPTSNCNPASLSSTWSTDLALANDHANTCDQGNSFGRQLHRSNRARSLRGKSYAPESQQLSSSD